MSISENNNQSTNNVEAEGNNQNEESGLSNFIRNIFGNRANAVIFQCTKFNKASSQFFDWKYRSY